MRILKNIILTFIIVVFFYPCFSQNSGYFLKKFVVCYTVENNKNQTEVLEKLHQQLTSNGIDVVNYIDSINLYVNDEITLNLMKYFDERGISGVIFFNNKKLSFTHKSELDKKQKSFEFIFEGDSATQLLKETIILNNPKQSNFLFSPKPEYINSIMTSRTTAVLNKPNISKSKIGLVDFNLKDMPNNILTVEKKEDYRYYFSNNISYVISFYSGTAGFISKSYKIKELDPDQNKKVLVLVLENTATRNKFFYYKENLKTKEELLDDFLIN